MVGRRELSVDKIYGKRYNLKENLSNNNMNGVSIKKPTKKRIFIDFLPTVAALIAVIALGIIFKQSFIKVLPCAVTLIVMLLQANVNRWGFLVGAANCIIYSIGFYMLGLYGTMANALFVSFPIQVLTFLLWQKNKYKSSTIIRKMSNKLRILALLLTVAAWITGYFIFKALGGNNVLLDNSVFILGLLAPILTLFAFIESCPINILTGIISVTLYSFLVAENISDITYLVIGIYSLLRSAQGFFNWCKLYREQKNMTPAQGGAQGDGRLQEKSGKTL